jgi:hypothetical protein
MHAHRPSSILARLEAADVSSLQSLLHTLHRASLLLVSHHHECGLEVLVPADRTELSVVLPGTVCGLVLWSTVVAVALAAALAVAGLVAGELAAPGLAAPALVADALVAPGLVAPELVAPGLVSPGLVASSH